MSEEKHGEHGAEEHGGGHGGGGHGGGHGGGGHAEGEHEGAPEWLISFADNVALLMGFFVILLAMNMAPKTAGPAGGKGEGGGGQDQRMVDFVIAVREGFNNPIRVGSTKPEEQQFVRRIIEREGGQGESPGIQGKFTNKQSLERGTGKDVTARVTFAANSPELSLPARQTIATASKKLKDLGYIIEVRGHASPFEANHGFDKANRLAYDRAMAVARALIDSGVPKENLSVVSRGDSDRLRPKAYERDEAAENQRVEIIVTNEPLPTDPHKAEITDEGEG